MTTNPNPQITVMYDPTAAQMADLDNRFTHHPPAPDQVVRYETLRRLGLELATAIVKSAPPGREQALALTNLEQAVMWTNAAIARHEGV